MSRPARPAATEAPALLARSAAVAAAGCAAVHALLLGDAPAGWPAVALVAMTVFCLPCAVHLWRRPGAAAWGLHAALALAMLGAHPLAAAVGPHVHAPAGSWAATAVPVLAGLALFLAVFRWWLGYDVAASVPSAPGSGRRVPHA